MWTTTSIERATVVEKFRKHLYEVPESP